MDGFILWPLLAGPPLYIISIYKHIYHIYIYIYIYTISIYRYRYSEVEESDNGTLIPSEDDMSVM